MWTKNREDNLKLVFSANVMCDRHEVDNLLSKIMFLGHFPNKRLFMQFVTIIPFFQREIGILQQSVKSALRQKVANHILIIDDGSPVPAHQELSIAGLSAHPDITVINQPNGGASVARNRGLDYLQALPFAVDAVAFLDSDDLWDDGHLQRARWSFTQGFDFYFADHQRSDWKSGKFQRHGLQIRDYPLVSGSEDIHEWHGSLSVAALDRHLVVTSSVVMCYQLATLIRFPRLALLEDDTSWAMAYQRGARVCFSSHLDVHMGKGVNISQDGVWGSQQSLRKTLTLIDGWQGAVQSLDLVLEPAIHDIWLRHLDVLLKDLARQALFGDLDTRIYVLRKPAAWSLLLKGICRLIKSRLKKLINN